MPKRLESVAIDEVSIVDRPANRHARVVLLKRDHTNPKKESTELSKKDSIYEAIRKLARLSHPGMSEDAAVAAFLKSETGNDLYDLYTAVETVEKAGTSIEKVAADAMLEVHAAAIRKAHPELSPEQAYVEAMDGHPDLAAAALAY